MGKEKCDYELAKRRVYGPIVLCSASKEQCPYKQSIKIASFEGTPVFRCIGNGQIEKKVREEKEEALFVQ